MKRVLLVGTDEDWEALWIDKKLYNQYHQIEEGEDRGLFFIALCEKYNLKLSDFQKAHANDKAIESLSSGRFPDEYEKVIDMVDLIETNIEVE